MNYYDILLAKKLEDDRDPRVEGLSVTENGRYEEDGVVYKPVIVSVAPPENSYQLKSITTPTSLATFNASAMPMPKLKVSVEAKQEGSGTPSPDNVRPIIGWDEAKVSDVDDVDNPTVTQTTTIPFSQTVYGAEVDVVNGTSGNKLTHGYKDLGSLTWYYRDSGTVIAPYFYADITNLNIKYEGNFSTTAYHLQCSQYESVARDATAFIDGKICADGAPISEQVTQIQIKDSRFTDAPSFKTAMNGVQLVYELATPTTFETQPTPIKSLNGINNLSVDCGEVIEGEYFIAL